MGLSKEQLIERMLLGRAKINLKIARKRSLEKQELDIVKKIASTIEKKPLYVDDTSRLTVSEIRDRTEKIRSSKEIKYVVVDFLQAMRSESNIDLQEEDFAEISRCLKLMALEFKVHVLLLVELNFDYIRKEEERTQPRLADFGKAIIVERFADVLMLINRENYYGYCAPDSTFTEIMITKNHNGPTGMVGLDFYDEFARFENIITE